MSRSWNLAWTVATVLMLAVGIQGTAQPTTLAAAVSGNTALQHVHHQELDELHIQQDAWTTAKDSNTLLNYAIHNTQNNLLATSNAGSYHYERRELLNQRNNELYNWNVALNNSVRANEFLIVNQVNQTHRLLNDDTEALDAQNVALMAEIGALRTGAQNTEPRTFGLTLARQESVHRKISEQVNWQAVETISLSHRSAKESFATTSHRLWGEKRDHNVKNDLLEMHVPTLKFQRDLQETLKLQETYKKKSEILRRSNYLSQVPALESTRNSLLATLKRLRIDNQKLREHKSHLEMERPSLHQDLLIQKTGEINALLEYNANEVRHQGMKTLFDTTKLETDTIEANNQQTQHNALTREHEAIVCQESVRELSKDNVYLQHQINVLNEHCTGF